MNILGNSIKEIRKSKKMTQTELSKLTGFKQNTISNHENGKRQLDETDIRTYAAALGVEPQQLFNLSKPTPSPLSTVTSHTNLDTRKIILLHNYDQLNEPRKESLIEASERLLKEQEGKTIDIHEKRAEYDARKRVRLSVPGKVSAGTGYWQEDDHDTEVDFYADEVPDEKEYDTIAIVVGHSMEPKIKNGDFLFIKLADQINLNQIGIFQVNGENYVKKLKEDRLESLNKEYKDIDLSEDDDIRTIGEVVNVYREN